MINVLSMLFSVVITTKFVKKLSQFFIAEKKKDGSNLKLPNFQQAIMMSINLRKSVTAFLLMFLKLVMKLGM